jgi:DNA modification methylase
MAPRVTAGLAAKQRIPVPSAVCDALQAEGWIVRNAIAWVKPDATPSSARDRCTPAHEAVFLLARSQRYRAHLERLATPAKHGRSRNTGRTYGDARGDAGSRRGASVPWEGDTAHPRDVWNIPTARFRGAHFATFPVELARRCVLAGSDVGDLVLDPFGGSGTVGHVAHALGRTAVLIDAQPEYFPLMVQRMATGTPR